MRSYDPSNELIGNYPPLDGTIEFYGRINSALKSSHTVLDLGAGRGAWFFDDRSEYRRALRSIRGKVSRFIGADADRAVLANQTTDENLLIEAGRIPLPDSSVDLIICDFVLEHVLDPHQFELEVFRVLKSGGLFCARTPHALHYVSLGARLISKIRHGRVLARVQPGRKTEDSFPTAYRCNSMKAISKYWARDRWKDFSYIYCPHPSYFFNSRRVYGFLSAMYKLLPRTLSANILIFLEKR
jgi:SAM-dependent methyltransferase